MLQDEQIPLANHQTPATKKFEDRPMPPVNESYLSDIKVFKDFSFV